MSGQLKSMGVINHFASRELSGLGRACVAFVAGAPQPAAWPCVAAHQPACSLASLLLSRPPLRAAHPAPTTLLPCPQRWVTSWWPPTWGGPWSLPCSTSSTTPCTTCLPARCAGAALRCAAPGAAVPRAAAPRCGAPCPLASLPPRHATTLSPPPLPSFALLRIPQTAHVGALYSAFLAMMLATGVPPIIAALSLGFMSNLFGSITHFGSGQAAVYYGAGARGRTRGWQGRGGRLPQGRACWPGRTCAHPVCRPSIAAPLYPTAQAT